MEHFPNEESATRFFEQQIWGDKPVCPRCKGIDTTPRPKRKGHRCNPCRKDFTIRKGTIFENSRLPLHKWLYAMYLIVTARKGISSLQLSKEIGVTQKTAWFLGHRIREACNDDPTILKGIVEIDEVYLGGKEKNKHWDKKFKGNQGRSTKTKAVVVGIRERNGHVKAKKLDSVKAAVVQRYIDQNVAQGSVLSTDEAKIYKSIKGYKKISVNHSAGIYVKNEASTNSIESVWALLKRGYVDTYHHFTKKHMGRYVDEFSFRLNVGSCDIDTIDRLKSLAIKSNNKQLTYEQLIH